MTVRLSGPFLFFTSLVLLLACKKDNETPEEVTPESPSLSVTVNGMADVDMFTADPGDTLTVQAAVSAPVGIESFSGVYTLQTSEEFVIDTYVPDTVITNYSMPTFQYYIDYTQADQDLVFTFQVTDTMSQSVSHSFTLSVNASPIIEHIDDTVAVYNDLTFGNLFNVIDRVSYFPYNVQTNTTKQGSVDFIFAYDAQARYILMSPDDVDADSIWNHNVTFNWPLTNINSTRFVSQDTSQVDFEEITTGTQLESLMNGGEVSILSELFVGQLISFRLDASRGNLPGILKVKQITGSSKSARRIIFDLKLGN